MFAPTLKEIFAVAAKLPAAPQVLAEMAELLEDVNADIEQVADLIRRDAVLTAAIVRISNTAYYGCGGVGSVEGAINRVGFAEVHRLVGCAATGIIADRMLAYYGIETERLRDNMICTAIAAESMAAAAGCNPRNLYTAGLLRPIGMMVLDRMARNSGDVVDEFEAERDGNYARWENRVMQIRNAAVTAVVLSEWRFAQDVVDAVRGHALSAATRDPTRGAAVLHLACWLTSQVGLGLPGESDAWQISAETLALANLPELAVTGYVNPLDEQFSLLRPALSF